MVLGFFKIKNYSPVYAVSDDYDFAANSSTELNGVDIWLNCIKYGWTDIDYRAKVGGLENEITQLVNGWDDLTAEQKYFCAIHNRGSVVQQRDAFFGYYSGSGMSDEQIEQAMYKYGDLYDSLMVQVRQARAARAMSILFKSTRGLSIDVGGGNMVAVLDIYKQVAGDLLTNYITFGIFSKEQDNVDGIVDYIESINGFAGSGLRDAPYPRVQNSPYQSNSEMADAILKVILTEGVRI
jgi:hypothetical protein